MKGNRLRRAILLGLTMTMAVSAAAMAADVTDYEGQIFSKPGMSDGQFQPWVKKDSEGNSIPTTYTGELSFTNKNSSQASIYLTDNIGRDVSIAPGDTNAGNITLNSYGSGIRTEGTPQSKDTHTIHLTSGGDNVIHFNQAEGSKGNGIDVEDHAGITLEAANGTNYITDKDVNGNRYNTTSSDGINLSSSSIDNSSVKLEGITNKIDVKGTGIDVHKNDNANGNVTLKATGSGEGTGNFIVSGNNGINHAGLGTITLESKNSINDIDAGENGVHVSSNGIVSISGTTNTITAKQDGILLANGTKALSDDTTTTNAPDAIKVDGKYNYISAGKNAVHSNGSGTITIKAVREDTETGDISTFADHVDYTNVLIGGENGIQTEADGDTNVIADADNYISGSKTGILSNGTSIITVDAGNTNYIGQYTDENESSVTSQTAIKASSGTINVTAGNENVITATVNGVVSDGSNTSVSLSGASNSIHVNNNAGGDVAGVDATGNGAVKIISSNGDLAVDLETTGTNAYGISAGRTTSGGTVGVKTAGNISIDIKAGAPNAKNGGVGGIYAKDSGNITLASGGNVNISTQSQVIEQAPGTGYNDVSGVRADSSNVTINANGFVSIENTDPNATIYGIRAGKSSNSQPAGVVTLTASGQDKQSYGLTVTSTGTLVYSIYAQDGTNDITTENGGISVVANGVDATNAVYTSSSSADTLNRLKANGNILLSAHNTNSINYAAGIFANSFNNTATTEIQGQNIAIDVGSQNNTAYGIYGYASGGKNTIDVSGNNIEIGANGNHVSYGILATNTDVTVDAAAATDIHSTGYGIYAWDHDTITDFLVDINSVGNNSVYGYSSGIVAAGLNAKVDMDSTSGTTAVTSAGTAVWAKDNGNVNVTSGISNSIAANTGIWAQTKGTVTLNAGTDNSIDVDASGIYVADAMSAVDLIAGNDNTIQSGEIRTVTVNNTDTAVGNASGIYAVNGGAVTLRAEHQNGILGAVYASGTGESGENKVASSVTIGGLTDEAGSTITSPVNYIGSAAVIAGAGDLGSSSDADLRNKKVVSALYAEGDADISLTGAQNVIYSYAESDDTNTLERTIWAYDGGNIEINGATLISTDSYDKSANSNDIAVAAGSAINLNKDAVLIEPDKRAQVTVNYDGNSSITGDILAAYAGRVDIKTADGTSNDAKINITGNLLAGNNGVLNVDLGNGGTLTGRADDYGDAGVVTSGDEHGKTFFNPAFSSEILKGGVINLTMGDNSRWNVTGQSWITSINTENSSRAIIDLVNANTDRNTYAHALTVYDMKGDAIFNMSLDKDRDVSDMLYMKKADGSYIVNVIDPVTQADMYANNFDGLRFATVGKDSNATFRAITYDQGVNNVEYEVGTDEYENNDENQYYNSTATDGSGNTEKPGDTLVDNFFTSTGEPGAKEDSTRTANNGIMLMAATEEMGTNTEENGTTVDSTTNYKLIGVKSTELSDAGKTVVSMSKVNYSNAIYMDRLNKRMGEARYLDGDEGLWVRIRHDRIGKSDAFRSKNTMMELGYDKRVDDREDGEHRQGVVLDYMRGTASYDNVIGDGDVRRGGLWLYDTWLGDKGHYTDYVLKFGRLSNDFEIYARSTGEKITGDYSNFVYSASAEYGRKKDLGNNWYIEPQAQIQYAHVTDADYTTSQGTQVDLDAIDSLIGRIGFRLGKDLGEKSTFYIKADVLHEFLGDQDIEARDATGFLDTTYENEGTWYDVGLGFSHQFSKGTYMFLDVEKTFGNDNEDTYQFNVGVNWKV